MLSTPLIEPKQVLTALHSLVILDLRAGPQAKEAYAHQHIHGAIHLDLETELSGTDHNPIHGGRHPLPVLNHWLQLLGTWGIGPNTEVVIYDASGGAMAAARAWWMLRAIGHRSVAVVNGGWDALLAAGVPTEDTVPHTHHAVDLYPCNLTEWPTVDADFVDAIRMDPQWLLVDARAPARFMGNEEPIDPVAGHIPHATNFFWQTQLTCETRFRSPESLRKQYSALIGKRPADHVICYCGSGVTACHVLLGLDAAGIQGARLYVGSWSEWSRQNRPQATHD